MSWAACAATWAQTPPVGYLDSFASETAKFTVSGAGTCSGASCHARNFKEGEATFGNEYDLWLSRGNGSHASAYNALLSDRSKVMAELLYGKGADPTKRTECLSCHALQAGTDRIGSIRFSVSEGVQCESCHGPSEKYYQPHSSPKAEWPKLTAAQKREQGMYDTRDLVHRAELCLSCHLGGPGREVTHDMYAAGHPELDFELAGDMFDIPKHWRDAPSLLADESPAAFQARTWAVGQAVTLRESARRVLQWADGGGGPDFAAFECYSCHHDLAAPSPNWRQERKRGGAASGTLGMPVWRGAGWAAGRGLAQAFSAEQGSRLLAGIDAVGKSLKLDGSGRDAVRKAAADVLSLSDELARKLAATKFDESKIADAMKRLFEDRRRLVSLDYRDAEQMARAAFALRLLHYKPEKPPANDKLVISIFDLQKSLLDDKGLAAPHTYDPVRFGAAAGKLADLNAPANR